MTNLTASWHLPGSPAPARPWPPTLPGLFGHLDTSTVLLLSEVMAKYSELWGQKPGVQRLPSSVWAHPPIETDEG